MLPQVVHVGLLSDEAQPWFLAARAVSDFEQVPRYTVCGTLAFSAYSVTVCSSMGRQHVRNRELSLQRQKTQVPFIVPVFAALEEAIDAMPSTDHLTLLVTAQGKPFTAAGFGNWFRQVCNEAGLPKRCTSHGLRKTAATRFADNGTTTTELMAWFGWRRPAKLSVTPAALIEEMPLPMPARSSFQEQELANQKSSLPKLKLSN